VGGVAGPSPSADTTREPKSDLNHLIVSLFQEKTKQKALDRMISSG